MSIDKKIVFILGAGASVHLGYPTGIELVRYLCRNPLDGKSEKHYLADEFIRVLKNSFSSSIDSFLEQRSDGIYAREFSDYAKQGIAQILISRENINTLSDFEGLNGIDNWYRYFWDKVFGDKEALTDGRLSFITFNYDVSFEYFLYTALINNYVHKEDELNDFMRKIPILHIHGQLAVLPWEEGYSGYEDAYGDDTPGKRRRAIERFHLIGDRASETVLDKARNKLSKANIICFLGFGFDKNNISKLNLKEIIHTIHKRDQYRHKDKIIYGSAYGLKDAQRKTVCELLGGNTTLGGEKESISDFFRQRFDHYLS